KDELKLEKEIAQVTKEAAKSGAELTTEQIKSIAQRRIAQEEASKKTRTPAKTDSEKFYEDLSGQEREVELLQAELAFRQQLNPLLGDYARRLEEFKIEQEL